MSLYLGYIGKGFHMEPMGIWPNLNTIPVNFSIEELSCKAQVRSHKKLYLVYTLEAHVHTILGLFHHWNDVLLMCHDLKNKYPRVYVYTTRLSSKRPRPETIVQL